MSEIAKIDEHAVGEELLPYYVYVLADGVTSPPEVFYVGRGQGDRINNHWDEFKRLSPRGNEVAASRKWLRFADIEKNGREPLAIVIGRFESEDEAKAVEAISIKWFYGIDLLTNEVNGRGAQYLREKGVWTSVQGLDEEETPHIHTREYTERHILELREVGAYDVLRELKIRIKETFGNAVEVRGFDAPGDRRFDPGEGTGYLGALVQMQGLDFLVFFDKKLKFQVLIPDTDRVHKMLDTIYTCWPMPQLIFVNTNGRYGHISRTKEDWDRRHGLTGWIPGKKSESDSKLLRAKYNSIDGVLAELNKLNEDLTKVGSLKPGKIPVVKDS